MFYNNFPTAYSQISSNKSLLLLYNSWPVSKPKLKRFCSPRLPPWSSNIDR